MNCAEAMSLMHGGVLWHKKYTFPIIETAYTCSDASNSSCVNSALYCVLSSANAVKGIRQVIAINANKIIDKYFFHTDAPLFY